MLMLVMLLACDKTPPPVPPAEPTPSVRGSDDTRFEGTAGETELPAKGQGIRTLVDVRTGAHDGFDRVVFEFSDAVPGVHVAYVDQPVRRCGSGEPTDIAGDGWLEVRMEPAVAHTDAGAPTVADRERALSLPVLREAELTCDFEGQVTWVLGLASPNPYRVLTLSEPPRIVVDVAQ